MAYDVREHVSLDILALKPIFDVSLDCPFLIHFNCTVWIVFRTERMASELCGGHLTSGVF